MSKGTVKWFNADKGFGFEYATLNDGQQVEFEVGQGQKGPCANKVKAL
jgi:CspA family cold shock protein